MAEKDDQKLTLWGVEIFAAAAQELSISSAARRLGVSVSSVSQQLTNVEKALGVTLLDRSARPMILSPAGKVFQRRALSILKEAAEARAELSRGDLMALPRLRLGVIEDFDSGVTPLLLRDLACKMSKTNFHLETGASHRLYEALDIQGLDLIVATDLGPSEPWMETHQLMEDPFVLVAPKEVVPKPDSFPDAPFIRYTTRHYIGRLIDTHLANQGHRYSHRFDLDSYHAILAMVSSGAGWTILPVLGVTHAKRFRDQVSIREMPGQPLSRRINLSARREILGDVPGDIAWSMRAILGERIVTPSHELFPFLKGRLRVLEA